jgi:hypothetical protein
MRNIVADSPARCIEADTSTGLSTLMSPHGRRRLQKSRQPPCHLGELR